MGVRILIFLICLSFCVRPVHSNIIAIPQIVAGVFGFANDVYTFFDNLLGKEDESKPASIGYERIIGEISEHIHMSTSTIIHKTEIAAHLTDVRRSARVLLQLVEDMELIVETTDQVKREAYKERFLEDFEREKNNIYAVKKLLTVTVPDISSNLLSLIVKEVDCGMTGINDFQSYYMNNLVSKAVALDLVYERFKGDILHNDKLEGWTSVVTTLLEEFEYEKEECKNSFFRLAKTDFDNIDNAKVLFDNNQNRFSYLQNDVLSLRGRYCAKYLKNYDKIFRKLDVHSHGIVAVFGDEDNEANFTDDLFERVSKTNFVRCMTDAETVNMINLFDILKYDVVFLLMFPDDQSENFEILLDQNTTANTGVTTQDNIAYKTIIYVRRQNSTKLDADDYETYFSASTASAVAFLVHKWWCFNLLMVTRSFHTLFFN